ncbi:choice-of-anchor M domain-containing protein [Kribbella sp. NBC_01245]|uniref:choice-of-anchor M domain-containing protein n=1 Tax=Kribbella sp. NBC_01245 TaxID=2903578 RepID=UPI002E29076D|nr:choice-of-anchor M domain-containing protein [Kribbella sp. NBC_01245]
MKAIVAVALLLGAAPTAAVATPPVPPTEQTVIATGHVDLGPRFVDGKWTIQLRDDTTDPVTWRPLENVVLQATGKSQLTVPADPAYAFLGKAGQKLWVIPQVQQADVVWPGWNTQDTEVATRVDREVTWSLEGIEGPGAFTLFLNSDFGKPAPVFDSRKTLPQATGVDVNTHVHGNWTFDAEGTYLLDIAMTAKLTDGSTVTDRRPLRLYAGDGDARTAFSVQPKEQPEAQQEPPKEANNPWPWVGGGALLLAVAGAAFVVRRRKAKA